MKAVVCKQYGAPEVLSIIETKKPIPKENEVLIRIKATAVNSADVRVRALDVPKYLKLIMRFALGFVKPRKPILGTVLSGIIEKTGAKITSFKEGDEVFAMTGFKFGAYAEYITLKENASIALKPKNASFEEAAAIIFGGSTAIHFLTKAMINDATKNILIYGATGSVGSSAIQIAKHYNANITAVCSKNGEGLVKNLGIDNVIIYEEENFTQNKNKYDIIFDAVGKTSKKKCINSLSKNGIFVTVGGLDVASETKEQLVLLKNLFEKNKLNAVIDKVYTLDDIVEAHRYVDTKRKKGNVVITV